MGSSTICHIIFVKLSYNVYGVYRSFIVVRALKLGRQRSASYASGPKFDTRVRNIFVLNFYLFC